MQEKIREKMERIGTLAHGDGVYMQLLASCCALEKAFDKITEALPAQQRELAWEFVMLSAEKGARKLEIACEHMEFAPDIAEQPDK